jgi:hypothetical protein
VWTVVLSLLAALTVAAGPAQAGPSGGCHDMICPGPGGGGGGGGGGGQSSEGHGATTHVQSCSLYATASNFGLSCLSGGVTGHVTTVKDILGKQAPPCWDVQIPQADLVDKYDIDPTTVNPAAPYYLHSCITGLDYNKSLYYQPTAQLNQIVTEIPVGSGECKKPYTDDMVGHCIMVLTHEQQIIVDAIQSRGARIPNFIIVPTPSTKVRTNETITYVAAPTQNNGDAVTKTPLFHLGGVTLWAQRVGFWIYPYGPDGKRVACSGGESGADACVWAYPASSAQQQGQVYPFRAEADWNVYFSAGGVTQQLGDTFKKYDDQPLPVYDVQSIVVH